MKESKSIKKAKDKNKKTNIFKKSYGNSNQYYNYIKSNNSNNSGNSKIGRKNYLISLLEKNTPKTINSNKFNLNSKKSNITKEIYLTSAFENMSNITKNKSKSKSKSKFHHGSINIKLNLNNEIINNNFNNYYTSKNKNFHKSRSNINLNEKMKEKDKLITKLQKELLQSQELLNQIQKEKQNELSITYNTIKKYNRLDKNNNHNRSLNALLKSPSLLKFNYNNNKIRMNKNNNNLFNSGFYTSNNIKYGVAPSSPKSNYIRCFSSSPHRFFTYNLDNLEFYNTNFSAKSSLYQKSNNNIKLNNKSNSNLFMRKNNKFPSRPELYFTRQLSYSNYNYKDLKINNDNNNNNLTFNKEFKDKCQKLKKRAKILLNNFILLINEQNEKKDNKTIC